MGEKNLSQKAMKICMEDTVQKVIDIFEVDDARSFDEKKKEAIAYLETQEDTLLAERVLRAAINDETGKKIKERFCNSGNISQSDTHVQIRCVKEIDKEDDIRNANGHWYGEFYLPSSTKVALGANVTSQDILKNQGFIFQTDL